MEFQEVEFGAVTFVLAETIFRETRAEVAHNRIARHLRDHARGRDREAVAIAIDDRRLRKWEGEHRQAVDEDVLGWNRECLEGCAHRFVSRAQYVDRVDLDRIDHADRPRDRTVRDEIVVNLFALLRQKLFGIVQLPVPKFLRQNNRRCYNRPGERAAARFIDARDGGNSKRAQFAFMPESAAPHAQNVIRRLRRFSQIIFPNLRQSAKSADEIIPAPQSLPCPCGSGDNSASRGERGLPSPLRLSRCVANEPETRARRLRRRKFGER